MRRTFNVRFSDRELAEIKLKARAKGWSAGRYIRWRALDLPEDRVTVLETQMKKLMEK